jgi:hypothetical protein
MAAKKKFELNTHLKSITRFIIKPQNSLTLEFSNSFKVSFELMIHFW